MTTAKAYKGIGMEGAIARWDTKNTGQDRSRRPLDWWLSARVLAARCSRWLRGQDTLQSRWRDVVIALRPWISVNRSSKLPERTSPRPAWTSMYDTETRRTCC